MLLNMVTLCSFSLGDGCRLPCNSRFLECSNADQPNTKEDRELQSNAIYLCHFEVSFSVFSTQKTLSMQENTPSLMS